MSDLATVPEQRRQLAPPPPRESAWLQRAIADHLNPHPDIGPSDVVPAVREEAARVLRQMDDWLRPASTEDWRRFTLPLVASVRNPPSKHDRDTRLSAIAFAMPDMPATLLTVEAQRRAVLRFQYWPSGAELGELLGEDLARVRAKRRVLERIATVQTPWTRATDEDRRVNAERARLLAAELRASAERVTQRPSRPSHLTPAQIIAALEARERDGTLTDPERTRLAHARRQAADQEAERGATGNAA